MRRAFRVTLTSTAVLALTLSLSGVAGSSVTPRLSSELIGPSQFPKGWSLYSSSGTVNAGCLTNVIGLSNVLQAKGVKQTASAQVFVEDNQSVPLVSEMLATYSNVKSAYAQIVKTLIACNHVRAKIFGAAVSGSMKQQPLTHFGDASQAFAASTSVMGTTFDEDLVIIRKGNVVVGIVEGGLPPVNVHQFQGIVVKALARVH
jgi:hypothetical protein